MEKNYFIYYVLFVDENEYKILENEKPLTKKELKETFEYVNDSIKVYTLCTNNGLKNCVYAKNVKKIN